MKILGEFSAIEKILDEIDEMLVRLPDVPEFEKQRQAAIVYRNELEFYQKNHSHSLFQKVINLSAKVTLSNTLGYIIPFEIENDNVNQNEQEKPKSHQTKESIVSRELVEIRVDTLINMLDECKMLDETECKKKIEMIISEFSKLEFCSKNFDQKLAEAQFELMKKYIKVGKIIEATEYAKRFSSDMSIYAYERLKNQAQKLQNEERTEEFNILNEYLTNNNLKPSELEFWNMVMKVERTEIEIKAQMKKEQKDKENKRTRYKKSVIRCDKQSSDGLLREQVGRLKKCRICEKNIKPYINHVQRGEKIKLIVQDGIRELPHACSIPREADEILLTQSVTEVELPKTLVDLGCSFFSYFKLDTIDLTETQITSIGPDTFYKAEINNIYCPIELKKIRQNAFYNARVNEMDLSETKLELLERYSFQSAQIPKVKFPKTLTDVESEAFYHSQIKNLDLSDTSIKDINYAVFDGAEILDLKLPNTIETVHENAFRNAKITMLKMYDTLVDVKDFAFSSSRIGKIDLQESNIENLSNAIFLNLESSQIILSNKAKSMGDYCFAYAKVKELDLSNTELENIGTGAFAFGKFSKVKFPKTIEKLDKGIFEGAEIEELDLSETKLENIDYEFLESFGKLKKIILPKELEERQHEIQEWLDKKQGDSKEKSRPKITIKEIEKIIENRKRENDH